MVKLVQSHPGLRYNLFSINTYNLQLFSSNMDNLKNICTLKNTTLARGQVRNKNLWLKQHRLYTGHLPLCQSLNGRGMKLFQKLAKGSKKEGRVFKMGEGAYLVFRCSKNLKPQAILCDVLGSQSTWGIFPFAE